MSALLSHIKALAALRDAFAEEAGYARQAREGPVVCNTLRRIADSYAFGGRVA